MIDIPDLITGSREVVAAQIGNEISNNKGHIYLALAAGVDEIQFLTRAHIQLMAECDLGEKWQELADSPTLFYVDAKGVPLLTIEDVSPCATVAAP